VEKFQLPSKLADEAVLVKERDDRVIENLVTLFQNDKIKIA